MTRYWPETLPSPIGPGYQLSPADPFLRSDMEVGASRNRVLTRARRDRVQAVWRMTALQFHGFRAWFEDLPWSLAGDSDDLSAWALTGASWAPSAGVGPGGQITGKLAETATTGDHRVDRSLPALVSGVTAFVTIALRAAGRNRARVALVGRDGTSRFANIDLAAGVVLGQSGVVSAAVRPLASGWHRVDLRAPVGAGGAAAALRVLALDDSGNQSYAGDISKGVEICEVNAALANDFNLFLPTGADGSVTGAGRGGAWALIPLWTGGAIAPVEARFEGMFETEILSGLNVHVTAPVEVRYA
ncbi:MAG: hypothetical protein ACK4S2_06940 [Gemmobacter sp.]|uniref:phage head spike fiber domain-containing protein n=1 Tax=Gemmobacter sp. TaxID=1898957 RepID=UPI00391BB157